MPGSRKIPNRLYCWGKYEHHGVNNIHTVIDIWKFIPINHKISSKIYHHQYILRLYCAFRSLNGVAWVGDGMNEYSAQWRSHVIRRLIRRNSQPADAEDCVQSAYVTLLDYRAKGTHVRSAEAFLNRAASFVAIDLFRRRRFTMGEGSASEEMDFADPSPASDEILIQRERLRHVESGLAQLPERTSQIFIMHRVERLKYREIADQLQISQSAVEKHIAKAATFLTEWMERW